MPVTSRFTSPKTQERIIALMMGVLFCTSVGAAYAWTQFVGRDLAIPELAAEIRKVGGLGIQLPVGWDAAQVDSDAETSDMPQTFVQPGANGARLQIAPILRTLPTPPSAVLEQAMRTMLRVDLRGNIAQINGMTPYRQGTLVGVTYTQLVTFKEDSTYHLWATLTRDARRHWVLHLSYPIRRQNLRDERVRLVDKLFDRVRNSARNLLDSPVVADDYARRGLDTDSHAAPLPQDLVASVAWEDQDAIAITPAAGQPWVELYRVRGTLDSGVDAPTHLLSPQLMLTHWFIAVMGREPEHDELVEQQIAGRRAWVVTLSTGVGDARTPLLARQLWYVRTSSGRALLLEAITEEGRLPAISGRIDALLKSLISPVDGAATNQPVGGVAEEMAAAVERGAQIAADMRALASQHDDEMLFHLAEQDSRPIGFTATLRSIATGNTGWPLLGESRVVQHLDRSRAFAQWQASRDFSSYVIRAMVIRASDELNIGGAFPRAIEQVEAQPGRIMATQQIRGKSMPVWSMATPPALVPPMVGDYWPVESIKTTTPLPAILWMSQGLDPPMPCLVEPAVPLSAAEDHLLSQAPGGTIYSLRPLISPDANRVIIDSHGRVLVELTNLTRGSPSGSMRIVQRRIAREELLQYFPRIGPELDAWENRKSTVP